MKKEKLKGLFLLIGLLVFGNCAVATPANTPSGLVVELRDGSRVVGKAVGDSLNFHSAALGDMKLAWAGIRSIEFDSAASTARLTATNGDVFSIQLAADSLNLETGFGQTAMPVKLIRSIKITVAKVDSAAGAPAVGEAGSRLTIELRDGSRVVGKGLNEAMSFHSTAMGDLKLAWPGIRSITFSAVDTDSAQLTATNGDGYVVQFASATVRVETSFGKTDLPVKLIRSIKVSAMNSLGQLPPGLVALWSGENNANDSVGGNNGKLMNSAGFAPGKMGSAFDLNGSEKGRGSYPGGGYVQIPASPSLDVGKGNGFTLTAWINPANLLYHMPIFEYERALGTSDMLNLGVEFYVMGSDSGVTGVAGPGSLYANIISATESEGHRTHEIISAPDLVDIDKWQFIALSYDKDSEVATIYLNGASVKQADIGSLTPETSGGLLLGARTVYGSVTSPSGIFSGKLDEVGIYNRALAADEIEAIYESAPAGN